MTVLSIKDELADIGLNGAALAKRLGVPENRIDQILNGQRSIIADTATTGDHNPKKT